MDADMCAKHYFFPCPVLVLVLWLDEWGIVLQMHGGTPVGEGDVLAPVSCLYILVLKAVVSKYFFFSNGRVRQHTLGAEMPIHLELAQNDKTVTTSAQ